jgi:hypothetical protein
MSKPWTEAHRREANIATRRLADEADIGGYPVCAAALTAIGFHREDDADERGHVGYVHADGMVEGLY